MSKVRIYNKTLCPLLWHNKKLDRDARTHLLQIAKDFYEKTEFKAPILDVYLMGSAANYNWTPDSDIDIHILINFNQLQMPAETAEKSVKTAASAWNNEHVIRIKGHKVEMNIQSMADKKEHVTGMYSLVKDAWIRMPQREFPNVNRVAIVGKYIQLKDYIEKSIQSGEREYMKSVKEYVDAFRQYGLDTKGELSMENLVFKILRSRGILKKLKNAITGIYDKQMSVNEVTQRDIRPSAPHSTAMYRGDIRMDRMTLGHLLNMRNKMGRFMDAHKRDEDQAQWQSLAAKYVMFDNEIKRRMKYINKPVDEGYGAGIPETDRLHIPGERWRIRSKDAPKTPKMKQEEVVAGDGHEIMNEATAPVNEMPQMTLRGSQAFADDKPLKSLHLEAIERNIVMFRSDKETFFPAGFTLVYFMDSEESADDMKNDKIPYLVIPRGTIHHGGSPITDVWKKRFQKPGTEHILGLIEAVTNENEVFIDMISVRPRWRRNRIASLMEKVISHHFPNAKWTTSSQTDKGKKFFDRDKEEEKEGFDENEEMTELTKKQEQDYLARPVPDKEDPYGNHLYTLEKKKIRIEVLKMEDFLKKKFAKILDMLVLDFNVRSNGDEYILFSDLRIKPQYRGKGYGTTITKTVQELSVKMGLPLRLYIDDSESSPDEVVRTKKLVLGLGFKEIRDNFFEYNGRVKKTREGLDPTMNESRIKWNREEGSEPFFVSTDGRYSLTPLYIGRQRPQKWKITDKETGEEKYALTLRDARDVADRMCDPNFVPNTKSYVAKGSPEQVAKQMQANYDYFIKNNQTANAEVVRKNAEAAGITLKLAKTEGFDPTSAGPNPQATEGQPPDPNFYQDHIEKMQQMEGISLKELLMESPKMDKLKKHRQSLTDDEKNTVVSSGAVWEDGRPGVWKSVVDGKTWYVCNTHRAYQCKPTLKGAIKAFQFVKTTS